MKKILKICLLVLLTGSVVIAGVYSWKCKQEIQYTDCLDEVAFSLNQEDVYMSQLGYYIVMEEREVEQQALLYNPNNTRDYWNLHVNGVFIQADAKNTVMDMAIHDELFYRLAKEEGIALDAEEQKSCQNAIADFWMDLLDEQVEHMPVSDEYIVETVRKAALAEKYQEILAKQEGRTKASYAWDGYYYKQLLDEQKLKINDKIWERITLGNISLRHGKPNYINGYK